jgi:Cu(I)/Ag(I) efflux system membrane protein CusA/SilA
MYARFTDRMHKAWLERMKVLNWELEDFASPAMDGLLLSALRDHAGKAGLAAKPLQDTDLAAIRDGRGEQFKTAFFLWHKNKNDLIKEMDSELQMPGWGNIWTQPIINRVDMLATGVRTMLGVKVFGTHQDDVTEAVAGADGLAASRPATGPERAASQPAAKTVLKEKGIQTISNEIAEVLRQVHGAVDVFPDQIVGRSYLQVDIDRAKAARYGVNVADIQEAIEVAMGGKVATTTVEDRRRFPVRVRYARDFWQTEKALRNTLVTGRRAGAAAAAEGGGETFQVPISDVADIKVVEGPSVIKSENGMLRSYVQLNVRDRDIVGFVEEAQRFYIEWAGQFESQVHARRTLTIIFPMVILLIFITLMITFNDWRDALLIILTVPGALVGGVIFQSIFKFNFSVAVWVGYIACFGMATQTGIVMLVYLHEAIRVRGGLAGIATEKDLTHAIITGAVHRLRPKLMTEGVAIIGLMPMLWASGVGAEVIRPMVAPVLGGLLVADEVIDLLIPVVFNWYQTRRWRAVHAAAESPAAVEPAP